MTALEAVPGRDLLNERRFALGESQALLIAIVGRVRVRLGDATGGGEVGRQMFAVDLPG